MQGSISNRAISLPLALICFIFILLNAAFSNYPVVEALAVRWGKFDENLGHALPMLALSLFFLVKSAKELELRKGIPLFAIALFPALIVLTWLMKRLDILVVQQLVVWGFIGLSILVMFRTESTKKALFAVSLLIFVIPVWDQLVPYLAELTTFVVQIVLQQSGIVAFFEGRNIELQSGIITVADACSGVRYVTIGLALSYLSAFTLPLTLTGRVKMILAGLFLSIFANWLRVYIIVLVGYYREMQSELVGDHELFGFILVFVVISPIAFYKPKVTNQVDKLGDLTFGWLASIFSKELNSKALSVKFIFILSISLTTALLLQLF